MRFPAYGGIADIENRDFLSDFIPCPKTCRVGHGWNDRGTCQNEGILKEATSLRDLRRIHTGRNQEIHMEYETLHFSVFEDIATITMHRPNEMNALNAQMRAELLHAFEFAQDDARVVVLTGHGNAFCSGQDLGHSETVASIDIETTLREEYVPLVRAISDCTIPTISAVNGAAAGAGANLALCTDITLAKESAYFLQAFTRIGLIPDAGGTYWLPRKIGLSRALGAALLSERISASEAADWGMIWRCVPDDEFEDFLAATARHLARGPTEAYRLAKQALGLSLEQSLEQQMDTECRLQGQASRTRDFREGVLAFLEKRPPEFEGR